MQKHINTIVIHCITIECALQILPNSDMNLLHEKATSILKEWFLSNPKNSAS